MVTKRGKFTLSTDTELPPRAVSVKGYITLFICLLECFIFGGTIFGWNVLVYVLKQDGVYSQLCAGPSVNASQPAHNLTHLHAGFVDTYLIEDDVFSTQVPQCPEQSQQFSLAFTIGIVAMGVLAFPAGWLFDKVGLLITRTIASILAISGFLILGFLTADTSVLIYPGCSLIAVAAVIIMITNNHVCTLAGPRTSTFVSLCSGASSSSGIIFQFVKLAHGAGIDRKYSLILITCLWCLVFVSTYILLPRYKILPTVVAPATEKITHNQHPPNGTSLHPTQTGAETKTAFEMSNTHGEVNKAFDMSNESPQTVATVSNGSIEPVPPPSIDGGDSRDPTFVQIVLSVPFWIHIYWFSMLHLRAQYYIGSFNQWVTEIVEGNTAKVSLISDVYGYSIVTAFFVAPIIGILTDKNRRHLTESGTTGVHRGVAVLVPLLLSSIVAGLLSCSVLVPREWMVYVSIALAHVSRGFLYASCFSFLGLAFPGQHYGKLFGVTYFMGGAANFLQHAFLLWANTVKNFTPANLTFLVLVVLTLVHPITVWWRCRQFHKKMLAGTSA